MFSTAPIDPGKLQLAPTKIEAPLNVPVDKPKRYASLDPQLPLREYGRHGLSRIYRGGGKEVRIHYREGRVAAVGRTGGKTLHVHRDALGHLVAISIGRSGAAFLRNPKTGNFLFADDVRLRFEKGRYIGFDATHDTRYLFEVIPEELAAKIVRNFTNERY